MSGNSALLDEVRAAVCEQAGSDAQVLGVWVGGQVVPPLPDGALVVRGVYVFGAERVAGLRSWRDTVEVELLHEGRAVHVVMHEASKWARFLLKSHPGPMLWSRGELVAMQETAPLMESVAVLNSSVIDRDAQRWLLVAGVGAEDAKSPLGPPERFAALEAWLLAVRRVVSA